jgi:DNA-binding NtrC family response regulator
MGWDDTGQDGEGEGARIIRLRPLRVLVVSADEPFRAVTAMLLSRRGCRTFSLTAPYAAAELVARERIDVVVVDGDERRLALADELAVSADVVPPVGIVPVGGVDQTALADEQALEKWTPFEDLFAAVLRADRARACNRALDTGWSPNPWARGARALD